MNAPCIYPEQETLIWPPPLSLVQDGDQNMTQEVGLALAALLLKNRWPISALFVRLGTKVHCSASTVLGAMGSPLTLAKASSGLLTVCLWS